MKQPYDNEDPIIRPSKRVKEGCSTLQETADRQNPEEAEHANQQIMASICQDCRQLDLTAATTRDGINVGTRFRRPPANECALCDMLRLARKLMVEALLSRDQSDAITIFRFTGISRTIIKNYDGDDGDVLIGLSMLSNGVLFRRSGKIPPVFSSSPNCLAVVPASEQGCPWRAIFNEACGYPIVSDNQEIPRMFIPQAVPRHFDASSVRKWIDFCCAHHTKLCVTTGERCPNLQLIDTSSESLRVVAAPRNAEYVALSWVWGPQSAAQAGCELGTDGARKLPSTLSLLMSDTLSVTKALGYKYLWVDKFCIDQTNENVKLEQIRHMDSVYECAELTIIAAAGADGSYGLPGVSSRPRKQQPMAFSGRYQITWSTADPREAIRSSTWSTRGWTFQEAVLSRRRLAFTDEQVYFECNAMNCFESIATPLELIHVKNKSKMLDCMRSGMFGRNEKLQFGRNVKHKLHAPSLFLQYVMYIEEYSGRELTKEQDSLNAFQGILQHFSKYAVEGGRAKFYHVCGIPYLHAPHRHLDINLSYFIDGLAWSHLGDKTPRQRTGFPSWSWAGWSGRVEYLHRVEKPYSKPNSYFTPLITDVSIHHSQGKHQFDFPLSSWKTAESPTPGEAVKLAFRAKKVPRQSYQLESNMFGNWKVDGGGAILYWSLGKANESEIHSQLVEGKSLISVPLGNLGPYGFHFILVLCRNLDDGTWSRVGLFVRKSFAAMSLEPEQEYFVIV
ncbi:heterokaryon incompatibility protein-domain-containing protein [Ilyonectria destructans]|nr:heterokaryon incompatibility protein-domain-containing protein [Ilyonectria destructans]